MGQKTYYVLERFLISRSAFSEETNERFMYKDSLASSMSSNSSMSHILPRDNRWEGEWDSLCGT